MWKIICCPLCALLTWVNYDEAKQNCVKAMTWVCTSGAFICSIRLPVAWDCNWIRYTIQNASQGLLVETIVLDSCCLTKYFFFVWIFFSDVNCQVSTSFLYKVCSCRRPICRWSLSFMLLIEDVMLQAFSSWDEADCSLGARTWVEHHLTNT